MIGLYIILSILFGILGYVITYLIIRKAVVRAIENSSVRDIYAKAEEINRQVEEIKKQLQKLSGEPVQQMGWPTGSR
jgi:rRNA processing protein Krr1/Pno1